MKEEKPIVAVAMPEDSLRGRIALWRQWSLLLGAGCLAACITVASLFPSQREPFFRSYLFAFVFWIGLSLGCASICLLHNLTSGQWGVAARRILEAGSSALPLLIVLGLPLPLAAFMGHVWPWAQHLIDPQDMPHKVRFFAPLAITLRTAIILSVWLAIVFLIGQGTRRIESTWRYAVAARVAKLSGLAIVAYVLTLTLASMDWLMSLTPQWYSTVYALMFVCGNALAALSFTLIILAQLVHYEPVAGHISRDQINDLASLTFAFIILWAYMSFSQFLISWMGNLKNEMLWYVPRTTGAWGLAGVLILCFQFFAPFILLLNRTIKRSPSALAWVCLGIFVLRAVDVYWVVKPAFANPLYADQRTTSWMDVVLLIGLGAAFLWISLGRLLKAPLAPPRLIDEFNAGDAMPQPVLIAGVNT